MKNIVLVLLLLLTPLLSSAQPILNNGFEFWTSFPYDRANGWLDSNPESIAMIGQNTVTKTTDSQSGFAIRLETKASGPDTAPGYITNSPDPLDAVGGVPYSSQPTHITGYYKYNLPGNDTALLLVIFKKNGLVISTDVFKIRGTGTQSTYAPFSLMLSPVTLPDTVIIAATSSNLLGSSPLSVGSYIQFDQLAFTGVGTMAPIPNGDFESWTALTVDEPSGWSVGYGDIQKTTDAFAGSFAVQLTSIDPFGTAIFSGSSASNGLPYTVQVDTLIGMYKYSSPGSDSAEIYINFSSGGSIFYGVMKKLGPASSYTAFEIPFNLPAVPDSVRINVWSSQYPGGVTGSVLKLDEIYFKSAPVGIMEYENPQEVLVFPNPVREQLNFRSPVFIQGSWKVEVSDHLGRVLIASKWTENGATDRSISTTDLPAGAYIYHLIETSTGKTISGKFLK